MINRSDFDIQSSVSPTKSRVRYQYEYFYRLKEISIAHGTGCFVIQSSQPEIDGHDEMYRVAYEFRTIDWTRHVLPIAARLPRWSGKKKERNEKKKERS